jgi:hypothetical protein
MWIKLFLIALLFLVPVLTEAHPGRTDASGCHTCRTNCASWGLSTGEYHCHNAKALPQPEEPIKSTYGENGTGYTQPAPEYKSPSTPISIPTNIVKTQEQQIKEAVLLEKDNYSKNPHWFRERLFKQLGDHFNNNFLVGYYIYTILTDIY